MSSKKLLDNIEEGLLNFYLDLDYSKESNLDVPLDDDYDGQMEKYEKIAKKILFIAQTHVKKIRVAKVISISDARSRLESIGEQITDSVFTIFKRHVENHGIAVNYRNFDKMTEAEMSSILEQLDITLLFEEIDASLEDE